MIIGKSENKKIRVAFFIEIFDKGGTEKATLDLINSLSTEKYDLTLIQFFAKGECSEQLKKHIRKRSNMIFSEKFSFRLSWWSRNFFRRIPLNLSHKILIGDRYDVEIGCGYEFPTKLVSYSKHAKKISWVHMDVLQDKNNVPSMTKEEGQEYFKNIDNIVCVSNNCEKNFNIKFGLEEKTKVAYNVVLEDEIINKSKVIIPDYSKDAINLVAVGRLEKEKGFDRLIEALGLLKSKKIHLYIVGEGREKYNLEAQIRELDLCDRVVLLGHMANPYPYIRYADLYVCSSWHESYSLTIAESLILETPVLSTNCAGPKELLQNGKYGLLVDNSTEGLYTALKEIVKDESILIDMKNRAKCEKDILIKYLL